MSSQPVKLALSVAGSLTIAFVTWLTLGTAASAGANVSALDMVTAGQQFSTQNLDEATVTREIAGHQVRQVDGHLAKLRYKAWLRHKAEVRARRRARAAAAAAAAAAAQQQRQQRQQQQAATTPTSSGGGGSYGAPPGSFQACVIAHESGGNPTAVNPSSGAGGLYQFLPSTWAGLGLGYPGGAQTAPPSVQTEGFFKLYAEAGPAPWAGDGC